jgi:hypothetical protein
MLRDAYHAREQLVGLLLRGEGSMVEIAAHLAVPFYVHGPLELGGLVETALKRESPFIAGRRVPRRGPLTDDCAVAAPKTADRADHCVPRDTSGLV